MMDFESYTISDDEVNNKALYCTILVVFFVAFSGYLTFKMQSRSLLGLSKIALINLRLENLLFFQLVHYDLIHWLENTVGLILVYFIWFELIPFSSFSTYLFYPLGILSGILSVFVLPNFILIGLSGFILIILGFEIPKLKILKINPYFIVFSVIAILSLSSFMTRSFTFDKSLIFGFASMFVHVFALLIGVLAYFIFQKFSKISSKSKLSVLQKI